MIIMTWNTPKCDMGTYNENFLKCKLANIIHIWSCKLKILFLFSEKYEFVGRLLRPGEQPRNYSDEEDEEESSVESANVAGGDGGGGGEKKKNE